MPHIQRPNITPQINTAPLKADKAANFGINRFQAGVAREFGNLPGANFQETSRQARPLTDQDLALARGRIGNVNEAQARESISGAAAAGLSSSAQSFIATQARGGAAARTGSQFADLTLANAREGAQLDLARRGQAIQRFQAFVAGTQPVLAARANQAQFRFGAQSAITEAGIQNTEFAQRANSPFQRSFNVQNASFF